VDLEGIARRRASTASTVIQTVSHAKRSKQQQESEPGEALAINFRERERPDRLGQAKSEADYVLRLAVT